MKPAMYRDKLAGPGQKPLHRTCFLSVSVFSSADRNEIAVCQCRTVRICCEIWNWEGEKHLRCSRAGRRAEDFCSHHQSAKALVRRQLSVLVYGARTRQNGDVPKHRKVWHCEMAIGKHTCWQQDIQPIRTLRPNVARGGCLRKRKTTFWQNIQITWKDWLAGFFVLWAIKKLHQRENQFQTTNTCKRLAHHCSRKQDALHHIFNFQNHRDRKRI